MRTRKEIIKVVNSQKSIERERASVQLILGVLLDIRDLLTNKENKQ